MTESFITLEFEPKELMGVLKPYQRKSIEELIQNFGEEDAAKKWLAANGPSSTQKFGGSQADNPKPFWDRFSQEFRLFVCGDKKYAKERKELLKQANPTALVVVSTISVVIATTLGLAPALITPVVVIMLKVVGRIGLNAWCAVS